LNRLNLAVSWLNRILWVLVLVFLPVSSFPYLTFPGFENALVRPLSLFPLFILVLTLILPKLLQERRLPVALGPFLFFCFAALLATAVGVLTAGVPQRGETALMRGIRGSLTLAIGAAFLTAGIFSVRSERAMRRSVRWLYIGFGISSMWCLFQASQILLDWPTYRFLNKIQRFFSMRDLVESRVSGFAFEPSWLATQLVIMVLPFLWAGRLLDYRIISSKKWARWLEWLLLLATILSLLFTYSRGGIPIFIAVSGLVTAFWAYRRREHWLPLFRRFFRRKAGTGGLRFERLLPALMLCVALAFGLFRLLEQNPNFSLLWGVFGVVSGPLQYLLEIGGGGRLAFMVAAWRTFLAYPFLGVGLGQAGFYMLDRFPVWSMQGVYEITTILAPSSSQYTNPKHLWFRLPAETGLIGTALFFLFLAGVLLAAFKLVSREEREAQFVGLAGMMSWLSILLLGHTLDSFATATMWIPLGILIGYEWGKSHKDRPNHSAGDPSLDELRLP
jgi:hypothetical protein